MGSVPGFATPAWLARHAVFKRFGPLDTNLRFADASDWFLRAAAGGLVCEILPNTLVMHRMHDSNLSRHRQDSSFEFLDLVKRHLDGRRTAPQSSK